MNSKNNEIQKKYARFKQVFSKKLREVIRLHSSHGYSRPKQYNILKRLNPNANIQALVPPNIYRYLQKSRLSENELLQFFTFLDENEVLGNYLPKMLYISHHGVPTLTERGDAHWYMFKRNASDIKTYDDILGLQKLDRQGPLRTTFREYNRRLHEFGPKLPLESDGNPMDYPRYWRQRFATRTLYTPESREKRWDKNKFFESIQDHDIIEADRHIRYQHIKNPYNKRKVTGTTRRVVPSNIPRRRVGILKNKLSPLQVAQMRQGSIAHRADRIPKRNGKFIHGKPMHWSKTRMFLKKGRSVAYKKAWYSKFKTVPKFRRKVKWY